jgi:hypothetical protein
MDKTNLLGFAGAILRGNPTANARLAISQFLEKEYREALAAPKPDEDETKPE